MYTSLPMNADMNVVWDLRAAEGIGSLATNQLDKLIGLVGKTWGTKGKNKAALVVSRQVDFSLARMYEQQLEMHSPSVVRIFKDIKKAVQWIDQEIH